MDKEMFFSKAALDQTTEVELSVGTVRVRSLTRMEIDQATKDGDPITSEANTFSYAVIDPVMDPAEWRQWFESATVGDYTRLADAVQEVSGLGKKEATKSVRGAKKRSRR